MRARAALGVAAAVSVSFALFTARAVAEDADAEAGAKDAIRKAATDFVATDYATAVARLAQAARACDPKHCTKGTRAFVLRDLGTMQLRMGDAEAAATSFVEALSLEPELVLSSKYDAPDLREAWEKAREASKSSPPPEEEVVEPPKAGDFTHTPPPEQKASTPVPVHFDYPGEAAPSRVVVKYRGAGMKEWASVDLSRTDGGWEGLIPCGDVAIGTMRYWVQGFDAGGYPIVSTGDSRHFYTVPIVDELSGNAPHLPGQPPPRSCTGGEGTAPAGEGGGAPRLWVGIALSVELMTMPEVNDACKLTSSGVPANASNLYCTTPGGQDFPTRAVPAGYAVNDALVAGQAGHVGGGLQGGDVRILLSADYAIRPNVLVGGRFGYVMNTYPGDAASKDGRAAGFRVHLEARGTYLFGDGAPLAHLGVTPMALAGVGLAEFDGHSGTQVTLGNVKGSEPMNAWNTDGPGFLFVGGGVRYLFSPRFAFTGALRLNLAFGNNVLPTCGPEISVAYGF